MPSQPVCFISTIHNTQAEADNNSSLVLVTLCEFWWHANDFPTQLYKLMPDKLQIHNVCIPHNSQCHPQMACCIHGPTIRSDCIHSTTFICANPRGGLCMRVPASQRFRHFVRSMDGPPLVCISTISASLEVKDSSLCLSDCRQSCQHHHHTRIIGRVAFVLQVYVVCTGLLEINVN